MDLETSMVKSALIYGDSVTLYSPTAGALMRLQAGGTSSSTLKQIDAALPFVRKAMVSGGRAAELAQLEATLDAARPYLSIPRRQLSSLLQLAPPDIRETMLEWTAPENPLAAELLKMTQPLVDLQLAEKRRVLKIRDSWKTIDKDGVEAFVDQLAAELDHPDTYLIVNEGLAGIVQALASRQERAERNVRHGAIASATLRYLPAFDQLTVAEALDVRTELALPVKNFRSAVRSFESELRDVPAPGPELDAEISDLWTTVVDPELANLEDQLKDNSSLRQLLLGGAGTPGSIVGGVAGLAATHYVSFGFDSIEHVVERVLSVALGVTGPAAVAQYRTNRELRRHRLYLLYGLNQKAGS